MLKISWWGSGIKQFIQDAPDTRWQSQNLNSKYPMLDTISSESCYCAFHMSRLPGDLERKTNAQTNYLDSTKWHMLCWPRTGCDSAGEDGSIFISYCLITSDHKRSSLQQHHLLSRSSLGWESRHVSTEFSAQGLTHKELARVGPYPEALRRNLLSSLSGVSRIQFLINISLRCWSSCWSLDGVIISS